MAADRCELGGGGPLEYVLEIDRLYTAYRVQYTLGPQAASKTQNAKGTSFSFRLLT